jgi:transposase
MRDFINPSKNQMTFLPPTIEEWLPEQHLARFVSEVIEGLDFRKIEEKYGTCGKRPYSPPLLTGLLFYGYATGVYSSRKIEQATYDSVAFRYLSGDTHPDHDTICEFRKRFLSELQGMFVQILLLAKELNFLKIGTVSIDGTKIQANASKHKAMSWKRACELENQLKEEVQKLLETAEEADRNEKREDGLDIPAEIAIREKRLTRIAEAKKSIEKRAKERAVQEQKEYEASLKRRAKQEKKGKKHLGMTPTPPSGSPSKDDQHNFTDPESRIMKYQGGFQQAYNAQAAVDIASKLIVAQDCSNRANDKNEMLPVLAKIDRNLGKPKKVIADTGYYNEAAITKTEKNGIKPYVAIGREGHNQTLESRINPGKRILSRKTFKGRMEARLKTASGRALYALRKTTSEPVFGIIKSVMRFRQFLLRGEKKAAGEWGLVCMAFNIKRLFNLKCAI